METHRRRVVARLEREGWTNLGGGRHDRFTHPDWPDAFVIVPRHRTLSAGVASSIAKAARWPPQES